MEQILEASKKEFQNVKEEIIEHFYGRYVEISAERQQKKDEDQTVKKAVEELKTDSLQEEEKKEDEPEIEKDNEICDKST